MSEDKFPSFYDFHDQTKLKTSMTNRFQMSFMLIKTKRILLMDFNELNILWSSQSIQNPSEILTRKLLYKNIENISLFIISIWFRAVLCGVHCIFGVGTSIGACVRFVRLVQLE